jgi:rod shape-determining protein MreC
VLALLVLTAFTLITLDYRSGGGGPLRRFGNTVFGPVENTASAVVRPIGRFFSGLGHLSSYQRQNAKLRKENQRLDEQLRLTDATRSQLADLQKLVHLAGQAQFHIVAARVTGVGSSLGFEWTASIDVGSNDGVRKDETVIDGDGLVGKTLAVGPTTTTVLLGADPTFSAGARLEASEDIGHVDGGGRNPMTFTLLASQGQIPVGDRPFVPELPIGHVTSVEKTPGALTRTAVVAPYVSFTRLDVVGVVVGAPRTIARDSLLPPRPTPSQTPSPNPTPSLQPGTSPSPTPSRTG